MRGVGFFNPYKISYEPVNVGSLQEAFEAGSVVNPEILGELGLTPKNAKYVAVLGTGDLNVALKVTAHKFSKSAEEKIKAAGGEAIKLEVVRGHHRTR
jgi:large subunit ribosomal protein L15